MSKNPINNPTLYAKYNRWLANFRETYIPERYNQVKLLDELINPDIDHFISISNRTDGKSFNYIHALISIAIEYDIGLTFLSRNMSLRTSYQELIQEIIDNDSTDLDHQDFNFIRSQYYVSLKYKSKTIAVISDLNNATQLKYYSNYLKKFPIIVYDEFLALEHDYLSYEWSSLKTIYESIDRLAEYPLITKPKIFYLGNAVNFESPILHGLKIFNILEKHPINTTRLYKYDFNIMLEMNRNDNANEQRNTRAFGSDNDAMTTAQFDTNDYNVATDLDRYQIRKNPRTIYVKLNHDYLKIWFNRDTLETILSIESRINEPYQYHLQLKDKRDDAVYLKDTYFDENHIRRYNRGKYMFDNTYSKNTITSDHYGINTLKINRLIRETLRHDSEQVERESKEKQFEDNYMEQTKKALIRKMWG